MKKRTRTIRNVYPDLPPSFVAALKCDFPECDLIATHNDGDLNFCVDHHRLYLFIQKLETLKLQKECWVAQ